MTQLSPGFKIAALVHLSALAVTMGTASAGGSARDYLNAPVGTWLTFYNFNYSTFVTPEDGLDISSRVRSNVVSNTVVATRTFDLAGRTAGLSAIVPYVGVDAATAGSTFSNEGFSDVNVMFQSNIFGGPALTREQFGSFVPQTYSSFHLLVSTPTGDYDPNQVVNPSSNRWAFRPKINYSYTPDEGKTWSEVYVSLSAFTTNSEYGPSGSARLEQDPLLFLEYHLSRNLTPRFWVSADAYYNTGGETKIDGIPQGNAADTLRLGCGAGISAWSGVQLIFNYEDVVAKPASEPDSQTFRFKMQKLW